VSGVLVEACVDAIDAAIEAERGGAGRIELCGELLQGGVTPSAGLIAAARERLRIPVFVLVRPRTGDFLYEATERDVMLRDIASMKPLGVDGVVIGALDADGRVDVATTRALIDAARPMQVTFHRAFDFAHDQDAALDALLGVGVDRVLTSGGGATALEGASTLARLRRKAGDRLTVLAGGKITASNVGELVRLSGVREVHVRAALPVASAMQFRRDTASLVRAALPDTYERSATRADELARVIASLDAVTRT
jgi:copper homeostasis protein